MKEIERKFLIDRFPEELPLIKEAVIFQSYITTSPETRIREYIEESAIHNHFGYKLTVKSDGDLTREEVQWEITPELYFELLKDINKKPIFKQYRTYKLPDGHILECSIVDDNTDTRFMYAEIEFKTEEDANNFKIPSYLGEEITYNKDYKMKNYWKRTRIEK